MYKVTENIYYLKPYHSFMCDILKAMRRSFRANSDYTISELEANIYLINPNARSFIKRGSLLENIYKLKDCPVDLCKEYGWNVSRYKSLLNGKWRGNTKLTEESNEDFKKIFIFFYESLLGYKTFNNTLFQSPSSLSKFRAMMSLNQVCPYCDITKINKDIVSVDHFLPKAVYPVLSIYPDNLIVACKACNEVIKGENIILPIAHPYYEDVSSHIKFMVDDSDTDKYEINTIIDPNTSKLMNTKISNFLDLFNIKNRYELNMIAELHDYRSEIRKKAIAELSGIAQARAVSRGDIETSVKKYFHDSIINNLNLKRAVDGSKLKNDYVRQILENEDYQSDVEYIEAQFNGAKQTFNK
ncbi:HNH endonuclease [Paenibacillus sp. MMO-177]|uniref:HNH endonuclease n=1 Tax=Paenibacillus sp. MMO-177 TaxID=3081289 RepID=UPI00301A0594